MGPFTRAPACIVLLEIFLLLAKTKHSFELAGVKPFMIFNCHGRFGEDYYKSV